MKKYIALFISTAVLLLAAFLLPSIVKGTIPEVPVTGLQPGVYAETVDANGVIEFRDKSELSVSLPVVPGKVFVEVGDKVQIGDIIAVVDKEQTLAAAANVLGLTESGFPPEVLEAFGGSDQSITELADYIPDEIIADANGVIGDLALVEGAAVLPNTVLATISSSGQLQAKVAVGEAQIARVKEGQQAIISGNAFTGREYHGTVSKIYPSARKQYVGTTQETVVDVLITIDAPDEAIKSGFTVKAAIRTAPDELCATLPYECVEQDEKGEYVYIYQAGKAFKTYIETGRELADSLEVLSGIEREDWVIAKPSAVRHNMFVRTAD